MWPAGLLQAYVVLHRDVRQLRHLLAAQSPACDVEIPRAVLDVERAQPRPPVAQGMRTSSPRAIAAIVVRSRTLDQPGARAHAGAMNNHINSGTALVTGANKGIGKEIARQLLAAGLTVYVGSRDAERGLRAVEELGAGARPLVIDVTDGKSIAAAAEQVEHLDILVNNAGVSAQGTDITEAGVEEFRQVYETNVFGVVAVTNAFLPLLRRSPTPRIVNVSSETGSIARSANGGSAAFAAYRSSKTCPQ